MSPDFELVWAYTEEQKARTADWFWIVGIFALSLVVVGFLLENLLFSLLVVLATLVLVLTATREQTPTVYTLSLRGLEVNDTLYPFRTLHAYHVDRTDREQLFLRFRSEHAFAPITAIPLDPEIAHEVEHLLGAHVRAEYVSEPFGHRIFTLIGF